jgi:hypothetical protein
MSCEGLISSDCTLNREARTLWRSEVTTWGFLESPAARPEQIRRALIQTLQQELWARLEQKPQWERQELVATFKELLEAP